MEVPAGEAWERWSELLRAVEAQGRVVYVTVGGRRVAALVPAALAQEWEELWDGDGPGGAAGVRRLEDVPVDPDIL